MKYENFEQANKRIGYDFNSKSVEENIKRIEYFFNVDVDYTNGYCVADGYCVGNNEKDLTNEEYLDLNRAVNMLNEMCDTTCYSIEKQFKLTDFRRMAKDCWQLENFDYSLCVIRSEDHSEYRLIMSDCKGKTTVFELISGEQFYNLIQKPAIDNNYKLMLENLDELKKNSSYATI